MQCLFKTCRAHLKELILINLGNNCDTLASQLIFERSLKVWKSER
jgi:hypothetical protein